MRGQAISLLVGLGAAAAVACGGGGGPVTGGTVPLSEGGYDAPKPSYDTPPQPSSSPDNSSPGTTYDQAPTDYQPTGGEDSTTGSSNDNAALCTNLCQVLVGGNCLEAISQGNGTDPVLPTQADCEAGCTQQIADDIAQQPCLAQAVDLFLCLFGAASSPSCDLITAVQGNNVSAMQAQQLADQAQASCADQLAAFTTCSPPPNMTNMDPGCMLPRCNRCATDCDRCSCDQDQAACTACEAQ